MKTTLGIRLLFTALILFSSALLAQISIKKTLAYSKGLGEDNFRILALTTDNRLFWNSNSTPWTAVPMTGLPAGYAIKDVQVYVKAAMYSTETRFIVLLQDNSFWFFAEGKNWTKVETKPIPDGKNIVSFSVIPSAGGLGNDAKFYILCEMEVCIRPVPNPNGR